MFRHLGLYLRNDWTVSESVRLVQYAELRGFETVWQADIPLSRDAFVSMAAYAGATTRIKLGVGVTDPWTRSTAALAAALLTLDELAPDRILAGFGVLPESLMTKLGLESRKPLLSLRETLSALRDLLAGLPVTVIGETVTLRDVRLDMNGRRDMPRRIPLYLGMTAPRSLALAGEIADGAIWNYLMSPSYGTMALEEMQKGAYVANRSPDYIARAQLIACAVHPDREVALSIGRRFVAGAILDQPALMRANGIPSNIVEDVARADAQGGLAEAAEVLPISVMQSVVACGTAAEVRSKVQEYLSHGATSPILYPLCEDVRYLLDVFTDPYQS
jgi:5,10-methylenetetrahydromethanopterin reductase